MNHAGSRPLRKAARAGRRILRRALPNGIRRWIELIAAESPTPDRVFAVAGSLAATALALRGAYRACGSEVRELIWSLHRLFRATGEATAIPTELKPFVPWLRGHVNSDSPASPSWRALFVQWTEVAGERLTMKNYHRPGWRERHARILIAAPLMMLASERLPSGEQGGPPPTAGESALRRLAEIILVFCDHLDLARQSELGRNRIVQDGNSGFGGFYGMIDDVRPPSQEEIKLSIETLARHLDAFSPDALPDGLAAVATGVIADLHSAIKSHAAVGHWPESFVFPLEPSREARSLWQRIIHR